MIKSILLTFDNIWLQFSNQAKRKTLVLGIVSKFHF